MNEKIFEGCYLITFSTFGDNDKGFLTVIESNKQIPFKLKRIYYIHNIGNISEIRGPHAHKQTEQCFINIQGKATYHLDNGIVKKKITLDEPNIGIYIGPKIWHYMNEFSKDIILLAVASTYFDENDYIRDYNEFLDYLTERS